VGGPCHAVGMDHPSPSSWTRTRFAERIGLAYPIVQGPFGGGYSTVALAAAVSDGGALGSFGAYTLPPAEIARTVAEIRARTSRPFAVNLWVPLGADREPFPRRAEIARHVAVLAPYYQELGLAPPEVPDVIGERFEDQAAALLEARPPVWSFIFGVPDGALLAEARRRGIVTLGTATTVDEAVALERAGVDAVVASGSDAGGHRGAFLGAVEESIVGTFSLVPQVADAVGVPVIAAGGVADGRGVAAALALGADGVQIGTAFLACDESGASAAHREALAGPGARVTALTRAFTGRPARGIVNRFMRDVRAVEAALAPFPLQGFLTGPLRTAAAARGRAEYLSLWAGQAAALASRRPAADCLRAIVDGTERALGRLASGAP